MITIGVDGARRDDALAIVACDVRAGYLWPLDIIERPPGAPEDYVHDKERADFAVRDAFERFDVWRLYADPQHIADLIVGWKNTYGEKRVIEWETYRPRPIAWAVRNFEQAISKGELSHDGDETLTRHIGNARRRMLTVLDDKERRMHTLTKDSFGSPRKIDGAMAAVLAWEARSDCIAAGGVWMGEDPPPPEPAKPERWTPGEAPDMGAFVPSVAVGPMGGMS